MSDKLHHNIVNRCLMLDSKAVSIFATLSDQAEEPALKIFWDKMSNEEKEHVEFWERVVELVENEMLPEVFDEPGNIIVELEEVELKIDQLWKRYQEAPNLLNAFLLAYRMEFYMLHQAFETIFNFMSTIPGEPNPFDTYEVHIQNFVDMFIHYGKETPVKLYKDYGEKTESYQYKFQEMN